MNRFLKIQHKFVEQNRPIFLLINNDGSITASTGVNNLFFTADTSAKAAAGLYEKIYGVKP